MESIGLINLDSAAPQQQSSPEKALQAELDSRLAALDVLTAQNTTLRGEIDTVLQALRLHAQEDKQIIRLLTTDLSSPTAIIRKAEDESCTMKSEADAALHTLHQRLHYVQELKRKIDQDLQLLRERLFNLGISSQS